MILPRHSLPPSAAPRGGVFVLAERIVFVSTSHSFLNYLSLLLLLLLPRQRARRESLWNPSTAIHACERAEKGRPEIWVMGKNLERQRNGCGKPVLGRTQILGSRIPMMPSCKSVTISSLKMAEVKSVRCSCLDKAVNYQCNSAFLG